VLAQTAANRLRYQLAEIPELCAYAWLDLAPSSSTRPGGIGRAHRTPPLPCREDILSLLGPGATGDVRDEHHDQNGPLPVVSVLGAWCDALGFPGVASISSAVGTLLRHHEAAVAASWAPEYADDIQRLYGRLAGLAQVWARRTPLTLPCPRCGLLSLAAIDGQDIRCGIDGCGVILRQAEYDRRAAAWADALDAA
jgi:hypothetical protein